MKQKSCLDDIRIQYTVLFRGYQLKEGLNEYFNVQEKQLRKSWIDGCHGHAGVEYLNSLS